MNQSEEIELSIEAAKEKIALAEGLKQLSANQLFKRLILDRFLKDHAVNMVYAKVAMGHQDPTNQTYIQNQLNAIGGLNQYFQLILQEGKIAKETLESHMEEQRLALEEEA